MMLFCDFSDFMVILRLMIILLYVILLEYNQIKLFYFIFNQYRY